MQPTTPPLNLVAIRQRFQKALLAWLKGTDPVQGLRQMRAVLGAVALIQPPEHVGFWRDAEALILAAINTREQQESCGFCQLDREWFDQGGFRRLVSKLDTPFKQLVRGCFEPDDELWGELKAALAPPAISTQSDALPDVGRDSSPSVGKPGEGVLDPAGHALAQMLAKTSSILPFVAQTALPRFPEEAAQAWYAASSRLLQTWGDRYEGGWPPFRSAVFGLCAAALTLNDLAFLRFTEALASVMDRVDDEQEAPVHIVAAIASVMDCLSGKDFLEHAALYSRLDLFAGRLEKLVAEETRIAQLMRGAPVVEAAPAVEIRVPQDGWEESAPAADSVQPSVLDYLQGLKLQVGCEPRSVAGPELQPVAVDPEGLDVASIPAVNWETPGVAESEACGDVCDPVVIVNAEGASEVMLDSDVASVEAAKPYARTLLEDGQLLCRVARDLEALANSLHLSGLSRQAGELAELVEKIQAADLDASQVRADLLQVIQFMQDQVGAVVMGFPPHANPRISELMDKLTACLPNSASRD